MIGRREFLRTSSLGAGAFLLFRYSSAGASGAGAGDSRIEVLLHEPLGTISPNIYGHFTENLGAVIYDGVWVGPNSKIPNVDGIRKDLIDELRKIKAPVIRYPGGCFADSYDWRDGIGPAERRPKRTNFWGGSDPNQFGTNEFVHFCKLVGAEPYLAANVRSLPARDFYQWVEYCNSPAGSTTLADMRAAAGYKDPFQVRYWGVGNESWGCGGNFTPQEYAVEFRRFATWVPTYGQDLSFVASGPSDDGWAWTREFLEEIVRKGPGQLRSIYGLALHYYTWNLSRGRTTDWDKGKGDAVKFDVVDWYELLRQGNVIDSLIDGHWKVMGEFDPQHQIKLVVDEWGPWYRPGSEAVPGHTLEQMPTLRDAVLSAMTLDIFQRHPTKIAMANCAQLINCLNSLYLAHEDKFCVTPVGHVFELYAAHQGGQSLRTVLTGPSVHYDRDGQPATLDGLSGSASLHGKELVLTVVNPHVTERREAEIAVPGATIRSATATVLTNSDIHAHNTFAERKAVVPANSTVEIKGTPVRYGFPPASVTRLVMTLA
ncbi:MAG: alpha-L-arabinofuranosidase [Acidobacteria bacterium]|nr:MAG: alpha-L-arabinofuranosidase [Acidobacteriota bacterium]